MELRTWTLTLSVMLLGAHTVQALVRVPDSKWVVTADSERKGNEAANLLNPDVGQYWHTEDVPHPHRLYIDMGSDQVITELLYLPTPGERDDRRVWPGVAANGRIGEYEVLVAKDAPTADYVSVASGTWADNPIVKNAWFEPVSARWVQLVAKSEAGGRGPFTSALGIALHGPQPSILNALVAESDAAIAFGDSASAGKMEPVGALPLVAVAAAMLPNGKVLTWSAYAHDTFIARDELPLGYTQTALWDPNSPDATAMVQVSNTEHDMFCPGIAMLPDGNVHVAGGSNDFATSIYDWQADEWLKAQDMNVPRGYQGNCPLPDGRVFTLGGSNSGPIGGKVAEMWSADSGWQRLDSIPPKPFLTDDYGGEYRSDNHVWLFPVAKDLIFHAGPSRMMHWINVAGEGGYSEAGERSDVGQMNGNAVMYDAYKLLTNGGCRSYEIGVTNTSSPPMALSLAHIIEIDGKVPTVREVQPMAYPRTFSCSTVLPDGTVLVTGGQLYPRLFTDDSAVMYPELFNPETETWTVLAPLTEPRTYHSIALLLPDARVLTSGGGLCQPDVDCDNHFDFQVYTPPYLFSADGSLAKRPVISEAPAAAAVGDTIFVRTNGSVSYFSLVRLGATTHALNNDSRRIVLKHKDAKGGADVSLPADEWLVLPGYWFLFAVDPQGVPSIAHLVQVTL